MSNRPTTSTNSLPKAAPTLSDDEIDQEKLNRRFEEMGRFGDVVRIPELHDHIAAFQRVKDQHRFDQAVFGRARILHKYRKPVVITIPGHFLNLLNGPSAFQSTKRITNLYIAFRTAKNMDEVYQMRSVPGFLFRCHLKHFKLFGFDLLPPPPDGRGYDQFGGNLWPHPNLQTMGIGLQGKLSVFIGVNSKNNQILPDVSHLLFLFHGHFQDRWPALSKAEIRIQYCSEQVLQLPSFQAPAFRIDPTHIPHTTLPDSGHSGDCPILAQIKLPSKYSHADLSHLELEDEPSGQDGARLDDLSIDLPTLNYLSFSRVSFELVKSLTKNTNFKLQHLCLKGSKQIPEAEEGGANQLKLSTELFKSLTTIKSEASYWSPVCLNGQDEFTALSTLVLLLDGSTAINSVAHLIKAASKTLTEVSLFSQYPFTFKLGLNKLRIMWEQHTRLGELLIHQCGLKKLHTMAMSMSHFKHWLALDTRKRACLQHIELLVDWSSEAEYEAYFNELSLEKLCESNLNFAGVESLMWYGSFTHDSDKGQKSRSELIDEFRWGLHKYYHKSQFIPVFLLDIYPLVDKLYPDYMGQVFSIDPVKTWNRR
ncbi:hypothetical protein T439DRAFT_331394 [Meredithblackwellia eburnea MCA 4105]